MLVRLGRGMSGNRQHSAAAAPGDGSLASVAASAVYDLDATMAASYPGSGNVWNNLVAGPADGSAAADYDFWLGDGSNSATYPTFTGTAGDKAAYFEMDGGDYFRIPANPPLLRDLHKTGGSASPFTLGLAFRTPASGAMTQFMFATVRASNQNGLSMLASNGALALRQHDGIVTANLTVGTLAHDTDYLILIAADYGGTLARVWFNSDTAATPTLGKNATTTNAHLPCEIGAADGLFPMIAGHRLYWSGLFNELFDNTKAAAVRAALAARHGRNYT